jgi:branched-chain amino acid transport system ATP-binding protein
MLKVENINAGYGDVQILWDMHMQVEEKSITALIGSNGVGKTTFIRTVAGSLKAKSGKIYYNGEDITLEPQTRRAQMGIMMVPEGRQLYNGLSVEDNLMMGAYIRNDKKKIKQDLEWVYTIMPRLKERRKQLAGTLSGGEAQMCAVSRGLMAAPKLLMIDELSLGLAPVMVEDLMNVLKKIHEEWNITIILVDQDVQTALEIASKGYVMVQGHVEMEDTSDKLLKNPDIRKAYMGM